MTSVPSRASQSNAGLGPAQEFQREPLRPDLKSSILVALFLSVLSLLLAVVPHAFVYARYHDFHYFSNFDDQIYNAIAKTAYFQPWHLRDPYTRPEEGVPSLYAPLIFTPYSALTRLLGLSTVDILPVMRFCGGLMLGLALSWCLFRFLAGTRHRLFWVAVCGAIFLGDAGTVGGRPLINNLVQYIQTRSLGWDPLGDYLIHFRVAAILLCLPFLLLLAAAFSDIERFSKYDMCLGICAFAALIYSYFFYWTAAAALISIIVAVEIAASAIGGKRWLDRRALRLSAVLVGGLAIGAPQMIGNITTFAAPQYKPSLQRIARGQNVQANDPRRFIHLKNYWALLNLIAGALLIVALRLWNLRVLWILMLVGYLLTNLAVVVPLDFENHHWILVTNPMSELLVLILLAHIVERFSAARSTRVVVAVVAGLIVVSGATLRGMGALHAEYGVGRTEALQKALPLSGIISRFDPDCTVVGSSQTAEAVFQLSHCAMLFSSPYTAVNTPIPDQEVHERHAFMYWLEGWRASEYAAVAGETMSSYTFGHPEWQPDFVSRARLAIFRRLEDDPGFRRTLMERYRPTIVVIEGKSGHKPRSEYQWKTLGSANGIFVYQLADEGSLPPKISHP